MISDESPQDHALKTNLKILIVSIWFGPVIVSSFILTFYNIQIKLEYVSYLLVESVATGFVWIVVVSLPALLNYMIARKFICGLDLMDVMKMFRIINICSSFFIALTLGVCYWKIFMRLEVTDSFDLRFDILIKSTAIYLAISLLFSEIFIRILTTSLIAKYERLPS